MNKLLIPILLLSMNVSLFAKQDGDDNSQQLFSQVDIYTAQAKVLFNSTPTETVQQKRVAINSMDGFEAWDSLRQGSMGEYPYHPEK